MFQTTKRHEAREEIGLPLSNRFIRFSPLSMFYQGDKQRKVALSWLVLCLIIVPSSTLTRIFEWTGISIDIAGMTTYLTIYVPMLLCVPLVMWFGYWWAAIPAYFSTFLVALLGGMPLGWIVIFSLANPIGLAIYAMFYRVTPLRCDLRGIESLVGFIMIALVASLAGSVGAFIWALTNNVGLNVAHPVWLGWWLGGWLQAVAIVGPVLYWCTPAAERYLAPIKNSYLHLHNARGAMLVMIASFVTILVCYVVAGRYIGLKQMESVNWLQGETMGIDQAQNIVDSLSYPLFILLAVMVALAYLAYRAVLFWHAIMRGVNEKLTVQNEQLVTLVNRDPLSGLYNRRKVFEQLSHDFARAVRTSGALSVLMVDADKFKRINDTHGHLVGDQVIQEIAARLQGGLREYDTAGRFGGEEFIAVLPDTALEEAAKIAERIREGIASTPVTTEAGTLNITVSIGVASLSGIDKDSQSVVDRADKALLRAKEGGRNRVVAA